ncbi:MAG: hypothetical protein ABIJ21_03745 [Nanoarchaeota archaeon]
MEQVIIVGLVAVLLLFLFLLVRLHLLQKRLSALEKTLNDFNADSRVEKRIR